MSTRRSLLQSAVFLPSLLCGSAFAQEMKPAVASQPPPIDFGNLPYQGMVTQMAERWRRDYGLPGVWCAFIKDGRVQACVASGTRKVGENWPASVNDHLNVGSVSKVITGSLIAFFVADGTIKYETTVGEVFPELAKQYPQSPLLKATLRQLMMHTAGLTGRPAYGTDKSGGVVWRYGQLKLSLSLPNLREPGDTSQYSNIGPIIAVAMVERLSKTSYESWLNGVLGKGIGLTNPTMLDYSVRPAPNEVFAHYITEGNVTVSNLLQRDGYRYAPQGSCSITLTDLCSFAQFTMTNSTRLKEQVYFELSSFSSQIPKVGFSKKGDEVVAPSRHTSAGWGGNDRNYLMHNGDTARGEYCEVWVNRYKRQSVIFYTNANNKDGTRTFMKGLSADLGRLRLL